MEYFMRDLRHAARGLVREPGLTVVVVLALALGIGATTAIFTVVDGVVLRPLPYAEPERLATLWTDNTKTGNDRDLVAPENFADIRALRATGGRVASLEPQRDGRWRSRARRRSVRVRRPLPDPRRTARARARLLG
jgi:hypothetical protein